MPSHRLPGDVIHLLTVQQNVIAGWQLRSRALKRVARRSPEWRPITPRVYTYGPSDPTDEQRRWAAVLHMGPHTRSRLAAAPWSPTDGMVAATVVTM